MKRYKVELTEEQMRVVQYFLELGFRTLMGQGDMISDELAGIARDLRPDQPDHKQLFDAYLLRRDHIHAIMRAVYNIAFEPNGYLSEKPEDIMIAQTIWDAIRSARGEGRMGNVLRQGSEPVPKIEVTED